MAKGTAKYIFISAGLFMAVTTLGNISFKVRTNQASRSNTIPRITKRKTAAARLSKITTRNITPYLPSIDISLKNVHDITISHKAIAGGDAPCITLINCYNIHITFNRLSNSKKSGLFIYNCRNILIEHNFFSDVSSGIYAEKSVSGGIKVEHNQFLNMQGPFPRGQFVQFNNINGPGNSISYNKCENIFGKSNPEDAISLFKSNGTAGSPIIIKANWIRGGGPSKTGGGIMLGDNGGSYLAAIENILVDPGQYGIAIAGGDHNSIIGNSIYAQSKSFTNVGLYVAGFGGIRCTNSTVAYNKVHYLNSKQSENDSWLGPNADKPLQWDTNYWQAPIDKSILPFHLISLKEN